MSRRAVLAPKQKAQRVLEADSDLAAPPAWRSRAVERSLERSRAEAELRSSRIVETALALLDSSDGTDFTIQAVAERMRVSTKTIYQYFSGKDELLVAMFEELQRTINRDLRELAGQESDPFLRLRAFVVGMLERATSSEGPSGARRLLVQHYFRLQLSRPDDLRHSYQALLNHLSDLIAAAAEAGAVDSTDAERTAALLLQTVTTATQASIIGSPIVDPAPSPEEVWAFCMSGIAARSERPHESTTRTG